MHSEDFEQQDEDEDTSPTAPFCDDVCIVVVISFQSKSRLSIQKGGGGGIGGGGKTFPLLYQKLSVCVRLNSVQRSLCSEVR